MTEKAANFIYVVLCKYWVFVVMGFHLAVASEGSPTGIKIIYMLFFLLSILIYSVSRLDNYLRLILLPLREGILKAGVLRS